MWLAVSLGQFGLCWTVCIIFLILIKKQAEACGVRSTHVDTFSKVENGRESETEFATSRKRDKNFYLSLAASIAAFRPGHAHGCTIVLKAAFADLDGSPE